MGVDYEEVIKKGKPKKKQQDQAACLHMFIGLLVSS